MNSLIKDANIPSDVKKLITCCFGNHYSFEAYELPCSGNTCKSCADKLINGKLKCNLCKKKHGMNEVNKKKPNPHVNQLIETYIDDLKKTLFDDLKATVEKFEDEKLNEDIDCRFENIEFELDIRIESVIAGLHEYREEFMKELKEIKEKLKKEAITNDIKAMQSKLYKISKNEYSCLINEEFMVLQNDLIESQAILAKHLKRLNLIKLDTREKIFYKDMVGEIIRLPYWKDFEKEDYIDFYKINDDGDESTTEMSQFCVLNENKIIAIDRLNREIKIIDVNTHKVEVFENQFTDRPWAICVGKDGHLFVRNSGIEIKIFVFNENLVYEKELKILHKKDYCLMSIDLHDSRNLIYLAYTYMNEIEVWDIDNERLIKTISIKGPDVVKFNKENIYVLSDTECDFEELKLVKRIKSGNCILILNKLNFQIMDKIEFNNWSDPQGLDFDENGNILTMAKKLDKNKIISNDLYLFVIDKNKEIVQKMRIINDNEKMSHIIYLNKTLYILYFQLIQIFKFKDF